MTTPTRSQPAPFVLESVQHYLIDLDGVVYTGNTALPGAAEFFALLRQHRLHFRCITNNSTLTAAQYVQKLASMGIEVAESEILTSSQATAVFLHEQYPTLTRILPIGEIGLVRALLDAGFTLVEQDPELVVCGYDRRLTYSRLMRAALSLRAGAAFVATNPDLSLPTELGLLPGNGTALAYLETATGIAPVVVGKPEATMLEVAMHSMGATPATTAIIGDGLRTDMLAGERAGVGTILVLTGVAQAEEVPGATVRLDLVLPGLADLAQRLRDLPPAANR